MGGSGGGSYRETPIGNDLRPNGGEGPIGNDLRPNGGGGGSYRAIPL